MLSPQDLVQLVAEGVARAHQYRELAPERVNTARLKMKNPENFDGRSTTAFNPWWEAVTMFQGFYPDTSNQQKIAWVGTLLTDTALAWHLQQYQELHDDDTWVHYVAAIKAEYHNEREAADAQLKLGQLRYQGSIRTYMTEFRALNNFARATGESLRKKVDMAMPDSILDMRFNQNPDDIIDDEPFLQATYRARVQVEKKKALKQAKEAMRSAGGPPPKDGKKDGQKPKDPSPKKKEGEMGTTRGNKPNLSAEYGQPDHWASEAAAMQGVPTVELTEHKASRGCHRCGKAGHRAARCYAGTTSKGTPLPQAPWRVSGNRK